MLSALCNTGIYCASSGRRVGRAKHGDVFMAAGRSLLDGSGHHMAPVLGGAMLRLNNIKFTTVRIELPWEEIGKRQGKRRALQNSSMHQKFRRDLASGRY
eukprot:6921045-Karenia_brevis.AAC.1